MADGLRVILKPLRHLGLPYWFMLGLIIGQRAETLFCPRDTGLLALLLLCDKLFHALLTLFQSGSLIIIVGFITGSSIRRRTIPMKLWDYFITSKKI